MPRRKPDPDDADRHHAADLRQASTELLGAVLQDARTLDQPCYDDRLLDPPHLLVVEAVRTLRRNGTTPLVAEVTAWLRDRGRCDARMVELLAESMLSSGPAFAPQLCDRLRRQRERARRRGAALAAAAAIQDGDPEARVAEHLDAAGPGATDSTLPPELDVEAILMGRELEPVPWAVHGLFAAGDSVMLAGEGGTGKSVVALDLALALATGRPFLGLEVPHPSPVLYVDEENPPHEVRRRIRLECVGRGLRSRPAGFCYRLHEGVTLRDAAGWVQLGARIEAAGARWVVLDSLIRFLGGLDEDSNTQASQFYMHLKAARIRHQCGFVVLAHFGKPSKERPGASVHRVRGASDWVNSSDQLLTLEGDRGSDVRTLTPQQRRTEVLPPMVISWRRTEDDTGAQLVLLGSETQTAERIVYRALEVVGPSGILRQDLIGQLDREGHAHAPRLVSRVLGRLAAQGQTTSRRQGKQIRVWLLAQAPEDPGGTTRDTRGT